MNLHGFSIGSPSAFRTTPTEQPSTSTAVSWSSLIMFVTSGVFHPEQYRGHSKLTEPPRASATLAMRVKLSMNSRLCLRDLWIFSLAASDALAKFSFCHDDQGVHGNEP